MADYQLTQTEEVIRSADGARIPNDPGNRDRIEYEAWLADGGVPDPYVPPEPQPPPADANARIDTGANSAVDAYNANTPPAVAGGQGGMTAEERLLRLEESLKAMCNGHMAYLNEPPVIK
jgi:hypothetical protein